MFIFSQIWHAKETAKYSKKIVVFIFYDVCRVYLTKLLLFLVKIIQDSCFRNYGFSSEVPREGELSLMDDPSHMTWRCKNGDERT